MGKNLLSVVLATRNEEQNIGPCLESIKEIADEIVIVDENSNDKTIDIVKKYHAKVFEVTHNDNFHITKQKAIDKATGNWVLQLDADERVTPELAKEIREVLSINNEAIVDRRPKDRSEWRLFQKHQKLIEDREESLDKKTGEVVAFFIPRLNFFLGKPLRYAGVYPDGVIRLFKKGRAWLPAKSVHELMEVDGVVAWLFNPLEHHDSPTFQRYLERANRYTDLTAEDYKKQKIPATYWTLFKFSFIVPAFYFLKLYFLHKGFLDGMHGFIWSLFSALHYPLAYFKYWQTQKK